MTALAYALSAAFFASSHFLAIRSASGPRILSHLPVVLWSIEPHDLQATLPLFFTLFFSVEFWLWHHARQAILDDESPHGRRRGRA